MIFVLLLILLIKLPTFAIGEDCIEDVSRTVLNISKIGDLDRGENSFCKNIRVESKTDHSLLPKVVTDSLGCYYLIGSNNDTLTNTVRPIYTRMEGNNSRFLHQCNDNNDMIWRGTMNPTIQNRNWSMTCQTWIAHRNVCKSCSTCDDSTCSEWRLVVDEGRLTIKNSVSKIEYDGHFDLVFNCGNNSSCSNSDSPTIGTASIIGISIFSIAMVAILFVIIISVDCKNSFETRWEKIAFNRWKRIERRREAEEESLTTRKWWRRNLKVATEEGIEGKPGELHTTKQTTELKPILKNKNTSLIERIDPVLEDKNKS